MNKEFNSSLLETEPVKKIVIFNYNDPADFLRDHWLLKKKANPQFSIRSWAQLLGIKSHSQLHQMIYGKRQIPLKYVPRIVNQLKLNLKEVQYFTDLVQLSKSKSLEEQVFIQNKILEQSDRKVPIKEIAQAEMLSDPLHFYILEIVSLSKRKISLHAIRDKLRIKLNLFEIKKYLETLVHLGYLREVGPHFYSKTHEHFFCAPGTPSDAVKLYHKNNLDYAKKAIDDQALNERDFSGTTFSIHHKDLSEAKAMLQDFRERFIQKFSSAEKNPDLIYHLETCLFAISK
jgi:uncharacterized protein (TIGR02147 family)